jgi:hypothetical protein
MVKECVETTFVLVARAPSVWMLRRLERQSWQGSFRHRLSLGRQSPFPTSEGDLRG